MEKEKMRKEAMRRLKSLEKELGLSPEVQKKFEKGVICVSKPDGSIEDIENEPIYAQKIKEFETRGYTVFHAVESHDIIAGQMLSLLYVSSDEDDWQVERFSPRGGYMAAYVFNLKYPKYSEFGSIFISADNGALFRTDLNRYA